MVNVSKSKFYRYVIHEMTFPNGMRKSCVIDHAYRLEHCKKHLSQAGKGNQFCY